MRDYDFIKKIFVEKNNIEFNNIEFDIDQCKFLSNILSNVNFYKRSIIFINCTFKGNLRIDNLKCNKLVFKDCIFLQGGGLKNREGNNKLHIKELIFKPFKLEGDFVIDLGKFSTDNGLINNETGIIENIKFENHQIGNGRIFFVGLNEKLVKGDFRNRILDNVIFENSNLENCCFLNSKIDKTEFRNIEFNKAINIPLFLLKENRIEGVFISLFILIGTILIGIFLMNQNINDNINVNVIFVFFVIILIIFIVMIGLSVLDVIYTFLLKILVQIIDKKSNTFLNRHISTKDEELILNELKLRKNKNYSDVLTSLNSLKHLYDELALNFSKTDKQLWGEFMYSSKYWNMIINKSLFDFFNVFPNRINHLVNGFGRRWFRSLFFLLLVSFLIFPLLFLYYIKPNEDYISTSYTPYFLLVDVTKDNNTSTPLLIYNYDSSFFKYQVINNFRENNDTLYGYDNRYNFNSKNQYILKLKNSFSVGLCKSLSNLLYPFNYENKKWFQNITPKAYIFSVIESIILWLLIIAFLKALWNIVKY